MVELTDDGRALVEALLAAPVAWRSPDELASATGRPLEETTDLLATLDAGGWLSAWERPGEVVVTLTVEAASRLQVRLVEAGPGRAPKWAPRSLPEPPAPRSTGVFRGERGASLELVVDPRPGPGSEADRAEEALARSASPAGPTRPVAVNTLPRPTMLVGSGLSPWPGPGEGRKSPCPACRSLPLGPSAYCLCCDRWGLDHLLHGETGGRPASPPCPTRDAAQDARRRERDRLARKRKRWSRRSAQAEAERRRKPGRPRTSHH